MCWAGRGWRQARIVRSTIANIPTPDLTIDDHCDMTRMVIAFIYSNVHGDNEQIDLSFFLSKYPKTKVYYVFGNQNHSSRHFSKIPLKSLRGVTVSIFAFFWSGAWMWFSVSTEKSEQTTPGSLGFYHLLHQLSQVPTSRVPQPTCFWLPKVRRGPCLVPTCSWKSKWVREPDQDQIRSYWILLFFYHVKICVH